MFCFMCDLFPFICVVASGYYCHFWNHGGDVLLRSCSQVQIRCKMWIHCTAAIVDFFDM